MLNNMAQKGVIRIPIRKEETGFLSQLHAEDYCDDYFGVNEPHTQTLTQTFDMNDPIQKEQAIQLG